MTEEDRIVVKAWGPREMNTPIEMGLRRAIRETARVCFGILTAEVPVGDLEAARGMKLIHDRFPEAFKEEPDGS